MARPVDSTGGAEAARQAAAEAARRAAEAAARQAAEAAARNKATSPSNTPARPAPTDQFAAPQTQGGRNTVNLEGGEPTGTGNAPAGALPSSPEDLPKLFPELKDKPKAELKKAYDSMKKLVEGDFSEKAAALGELAGQFPDTTQNVLDKLGVKDNKLAKLATNKDALAALGKLTSKESSVADKASAALELANSAGEIFKPEELKGVLGKVLNGMPAGAKLADAIGAFTDPSKTGTDKAKATLELASALKDFAGKEFPKLANDLRKLDGTFRAAGAAITLLDPKASAQDKALAAAQLAAEIPDLSKDLTAFKDALKQYGVKGADAAVDQAAQLATVKGLDPSLAQKLTPEQLKGLESVATKVGPENLKGVLEGIKDPKALDGLVGQLGKLDDAAGKRLLKSLGGMEHGALAKALSDPKTLEQLGTLATKLDDAGADLIGKLAKDMDPDGLKMLLKFTDGVDGSALKTGLAGLKPLLEQGGGKLVGKGLKLLDGMLGKMGVEVTAEVAGKVFKNLAKAIPLAGAVPGLIDAAKFGQEAIDLHGKNKDLGFYALVGANLNAADAVVGTVLDFTGVGAAVDLGVGAAFGVAELALELSFDAEKAKMEADPQNYQAPDWMKAVNLAAAAAMGPSGVAQLAAYYGPEGAAELTQWGIEKGAKGAVDLAKFAGVSAAEFTGDSLKTTAGFIRGLADVIRNPSKYGEAIATKARDTLNAALEKGGEIAAEAKKVLGTVIDEAKKLGAKGLDTLKFIAQNPGEAAKMAVDGIKSMIESGGELLKQGGEAVLKKAVETLEGLKQGWENLKGAAKEKAAELIEGAKGALKSALNKAVELGEKGLETLTWAATHPGEVGELAKKALTDVLAKGGELAKKAWDGIKGLGAKGLELAESTIKTLQDAGGKAVDTLKYIAENPGEAAAKVRDWAGQTLSNIARKGGELAKEAATAIKDFVDRRVDWAKKFATDLLKEGVSAFKEVAKAWGQNLTEGGKEILSALKDLGSAGVDALKDLANAGGQLAEAAVGYLGDLAKMGIDAAKGALDGLAQLGGEVGRLASGAFDAVKNATNGETTVFGYEVDLNPFW
ncbi:Dauer Up-regulated [Stigmatella sp. ncwal1]|uniref:Dauer Up-regulated n=1 Tax=Stigmatella ashevillensis TaxID=2995309 RepID=A0ABT5DHL1_9BACT|nr:Dauer Up-regulated [Stigmatella ashevillena]MDC0713157.1 Dauer Up-regulated [Stigmatella ashevillena]